MYKVAKKYTKGPEQFVENFSDIEKAKDFIKKKLQEDVAMKMVTTYLLYDVVDLLETFDQSTLNASNTNSDSSGSHGSGMSSSQSHRHSPMQTTLRPGGLPLSAPKSDDEKNK